MQVQLFKKLNKYTDKDGNEKQSTRFYVRCGDSLVPVEVPYFEGADGKDYQYSSRKAILSAFAEVLPDRAKSSANPGADGEGEAKPNLQTFDDGGSTPF